MVLGDENWQTKNGSPLVSQKKYIYNLFLKYGRENCASIATPILNELKLSKNLDKKVCDAKTHADYKKLLRELIYLMVQTQPDFTYFLSKLAQFMSYLCGKHWTVLKRVLKHLQDT